MEIKRPSLKELIKFASVFVTPYLRNILICVVILGMLEIFFMIRIPFVNADIINTLANSQWDGFKYHSFLLIALFAGQLVIGGVSKYSLLLYNENIEKNIRKTIFAHVITQPPEFNDKHSTGDILSRILNDTPKLKVFISNVAIQFLFDLLAILVTFTILIHRSLILSLIVFAFAPFAVLTGFLFKSKLSNTTRIVQESAATLTSKLQTWISRLLGIKIYTIEHEALRQFEWDNSLYTQSTIKAGTWSIWISLVNAIFLSAPSILVLVVGGYFCLQNRLTIGELFAFLTFSTYFISPLQRIIAMINVELPKIYPIFERFEEFGMVGASVRKIDSANIPQNISSLDKLVVKDLTYTNEKTQFKLYIPELSFYKGQIYGIKGENGSGKTTLAKILKGILPPKNGDIFLSGSHNKPIKSAEQIFLLSQDAFFFDGSLQDNIVLFEANSNVEKYLEIIRVLDIQKYEHIFLHTNHAERSRILSGGELQKINMARMFYSSCPILILDEPDSFIDGKTKETLVERLMKMRQDKIIIIITHDQELLSICDIIYQIKYASGDIKYSTILV